MLGRLVHRLPADGLAGRLFREFFLEAVEPIAEFAAITGIQLAPGTFELIGPKINGNPEGVTSHQLARHGLQHLAGIGTTVPEIKAYVRWLAFTEGIEGVVWHHPDGRMAKLKARDLGPSNDSDGGPVPGVEAEGYRA